MKQFFTEVLFMPNKEDRPCVELYFSGVLYNMPHIAIMCGVNENISVESLITIGFERFGVTFFSHLEGAFSFVLHDKQARLLYLVKDQVSLRPLYFAQTANGFICGETLKDFYTTASFTPKINHDALALYLSYGYIIQPYTIFDDCYKVKSGHYVVCDLQKHSWEQIKYWSLEGCYAHPKTHQSEEEIVKKVESLLHEAVSKRIKPLAPIAASLSGGYDSAMVCALLKAHSSTPIDTFTIGFEEEHLNEAPHAKKIAQFLGTNHHEHYFSDEDAVKIIPKLCDIYDEPFADYGATPTVLMAEFVKQSGFKDLYVGDGGDEVFATADDFVRFDRLSRMPTFIKKSFIALLHPLSYLPIQSLHSGENFSTKYYKLKSFFKAKTISQMVQTKTALFTKEQLPFLLINPIKPLLTTYDEIDFPHHAQCVDQIIGTYFKVTMTDAELIKSASAAAHADLCIHAPLLDLDLISAMAKVPQELKIKNGIKKYLLKEIAHRHIPKPLLERPKSGFNIPFAAWLRGSLKPLLYAQINAERLEKDGIFHPEAILKIRDAFYKGDDGYQYKLWTLFLFQLWHEAFLKRTQESRKSNDI